MTKDYFQNNRPEMLTFLNAKKYNKILDVGCGSGNFGLQLKDHNNQCVVWGIEPNKYAYEIANTKLDHAINSLYNTKVIDTINKKFDLIIFNDILEHTPNPEELLFSSKKLLKPNGEILISVPNVRYYFVLYKLIFLADWEYKDEGVLDRTHLKFFTNKSFQRIIKNAGFKILKSSGINQINFKKQRLKHKILYNVFKPYINDSKYLQFGYLIKPQ